MSAMSENAKICDESPVTRRVDVRLLTENIRFLELVARLRFGGNVSKALNWCVETAKMTVKESK